MLKYNKSVRTLLNPRVGSDRPFYIERGRRLLGGGRRACAGAGREVVENDAGLEWIVHVAGRGRKRASPRLARVEA